MELAGDEVETVGAAEDAVNVDAEELRALND
jgi:hypothetical protein